MSKYSKGHLDSLFSQTEELLKDLGSLDRFSEEAKGHGSDMAHEQARERFLKGEEYDFLPIDGSVEFSISEDKMEVSANLYPPGEGREPIQMDSVREELQETGVQFGIDWAVLQEALFQCNTERRELREVPVAHGRAPEHRIPAHFQVEEISGGEAKSEEEHPDRVDYRTRSPFALVKRGDVIARLVPEQPGAEGTNVLGETLPASTQEISSLKPGKNTEVHDDRVTAAIDGRLDKDENLFWVSEVLEISGNVDYSTGHIEFAGDVLIHGEIKDGFKVHAGGDVYCATTLDASEVVAGGDLTVRKGVIGRRQGSVQVGGNITAKFIENCYVEAGGTITVEAGVLHSAVYAGERVEAGARSMIVGGEIHCQDGLVVTQVGTETGAATQIYCGTDHRIEQKLEWIRDKSVALAGKQTAAKKAMERSPEKQQELQLLLEKLQAAIRRLNDAAQQLVFRLDKNDGAAVRVRGAIMPGTYLEICHVSHVVNKKKSSVEFHLDKESGKLVSTSLR